MNSTEQLEIIEAAITVCKKANAAKGNGLDSYEYHLMSEWRAVALDDVKKAFGLESLQQAMDIVTVCSMYAAQEVRKVEHELLN